MENPFLDFFKLFMKLVFFVYKIEQSIIWTKFITNEFRNL